MGSYVALWLHSIYQIVAGRYAYFCSLAGSYSTIRPSVFSKEAGSCGQAGSTSSWSSWSRTSWGASGNQVRAVAIATSQSWLLTVSLVWLSVVDYRWVYFIVSVP